MIGSKMQVKQVQQNSTTLEQNYVKDVCKSV